MSENKIHTARCLLSQIQDDIRTSDAHLHSLERFVEMRQTLSDMDKRMLRRIIVDARDPLKKYDSF